MERAKRRSAVAVGVCVKRSATNGDRSFSKTFLADRLFKRPFYRYQCSNRKNKSKAIHRLDNELTSLVTDLTQLSMGWRAVPTKSCAGYEIYFGELIFVFCFFDKK